MELEPLTLEEAGKIKVGDRLIVLDNDHSVPEHRRQSNYIKGQIVEVERVKLERLIPDRPFYTIFTVNEYNARNGWVYYKFAHTPPKTLPALKEYE